MIYSKAQNRSSGSWVAASQDIITEILVCLPIKSLIRFNSVSNQWFSLITSPMFSAKHARRYPHPKPSGVFFVNQVSRIPEFIIALKTNSPTTNPPPAFLSALGPLRILQSCNGLVLCKATSFSTLPDGYYICNPCTGRFNFIPCSGDLENKQLIAANIAYHPLNLPYYRLVFIWRLDNDDSATSTYQVEMYSPSSGQWTTCDDLFTAAPISIIDLQHGVFWNGAVHWMIIRDRYSFYFDIENVCVKKLEKPPLPMELVDEHPHSYNQRFGYFGECQGRLFSVLEMPFYSTIRLDVLQMEKDYSGWILKYNIQFSEVESQFPEILPTISDDDHDEYYYYMAYGYGCDYKVLTVFPIPGEGEEEDEEFGVVISIPGKMIYYNPKRKCCELMHHMPLSNNR